MLTGTGSVRPVLIRATEAAAILGVDPKTVRTWAAEGAMPSKAIVTFPGGRLRFVKSEIEAILAGSLNGRQAS